MPSGLAVTLDTVIVAVTSNSPRVLTVDTPTGSALPSGPLDTGNHPTLERGMRDWVQRSTGLTLGYAEQLYTFGDRHRGETEPSLRRLGIAYLALMGERPPPAGEAHWRDIYAFLPWEDWRQRRPEIIVDELLPGLQDWAQGHPQRSERIALHFGLNGMPWDTERCLDRYELLWEADLVSEAQHPHPLPRHTNGLSMARDYRRILATALGRMRGKIRYRPVIFEMLPDPFTLSQLQKVVEALAGKRLHVQNFRRLVEHAGLVEATGAHTHAGRGRPAALFRFRREVFRERPQPGVSYRGAWYSD